MVYRYNYLKRDIPCSAMIFNDGDYTVAHHFESGREWYDPDPTRVFQQALNFLPNGGKIFIKAGTYELKSLGQVPGAERYCLVLKSRIHLIGEGWNTILKLADGQNAALITLQGRVDGVTCVEDASIEDLVLDGNRAGQTSGGWGITSGRSGSSSSLSKRCLVRRVKITNTYNNNIVWVSGEDDVLIHNYFDGEGIKAGDTVIYGEAKGGVIAFNIFNKGYIEHACLSSAGKFDISRFSDTLIFGNKIIGPIKYGILWESCRGARIIGNILDNASIFVDEFMINTTSYGFPEEVEIANNVLINEKATINVYSGRYIDIHDNILRDVGSWGIVVSIYNRASITSDFDSHIMVHDNLIINPDVNRVGGGAIAVGSLHPTYKNKNVSIYGNKIINPLTTGILYGIHLTSGLDTAEVFNNIIKGAFSTPISRDGVNLKIHDNVGFDTETFKATSLSVTIGTSGVYGSAKTITSLSGLITYPRIKITWGGTFGTGETVTVGIEAVYSDGSKSTLVEKSATATGSLWLSDDDILTLIANGKDIVQLNIYAKTNLSSTSVTVTVDAYGKA